MFVLVYKSENWPISSVCVFRFYGDRYLIITRNRNSIFSNNIVQGPEKRRSEGAVN